MLRVPGDLLVEHVQRGPDALRLLLELVAAPAQERDAVGLARLRAQQLGEPPQVRDAQPGIAQLGRWSTVS